MSRKVYFYAQILAMRETKFIEQNSGKWSEFETTLREGRQHPGKVDAAFCGDY